MDGTVGAGIGGGKTEIWKKFIILTGPRERVAKCHALSYGKTVGGQEAEDRSKGKI